MTQRQRGEYAKTLRRATRAVANALRAERSEGTMKTESDSFATTDRVAFYKHLKRELTTPRGRRVTRRPTGSVSIVSGDAADKLVRVLRADDRLASIDYHGIKISIRRLTKGRTQQGKVRLSGGVRVEIRLPRPKCGSIYDGRYSRRLGPGWTKDQLRRMASRCYAEASRDRVLWGLRDETMADFDPHNNNTALIEAAEAEGQASGRTIEYAKMTGDDCFFWKEWLRSQLAGQRENQ